MTGARSFQVRRAELPRRAVKLLLARGLLTPSEVHRHGVCVRDRSASNGVVVVEVEDNRAYAVKDVSRCRSDDGQGDPAREIVVYRWASVQADATALMPELLIYSEHEALLVLEASRSVHRLDHLADAEFGMVPLSQLFGRALGQWHRVGAGVSGLPPAEPWILSLGRPRAEPVLDQSPQLRELARAILSDPSHRRAIEAVGRTWSTDTTIHGDVRWSNVLMEPEVGRTLFIDWECAGSGDAMWDLAGGVQEYLSARRARASEDLEAFMNSYADERGRPVEWRRLAPFVACRLLHRALQLTTWLTHAHEHVERHRALARDVLAEKA